MPSLASLKAKRALSTAMAMSRDGRDFVLQDAFNDDMRVCWHEPSYIRNTPNELSG